MKKTLFFLTTFVVACVSASAQSTDVPCVAGDRFGSANSVELYVQYNPMTLEGSDGDLDFTGFTFGFQKAYNISGGGSWYIDPGVAVSYAHWNRDSFGEDDDDCYEEKIDFWFLKVPVNFVYKWSVSDNFSILPFAGITFRYGISGKYRLEHMDKDDYEDDISISLYDDHDMEDVCLDAWGRLQVGWQIGCNVMFSEKTFLGFSHGSDFYGLTDGRKFKTTSLTLGYCF